jgi:hypothetical protein
MFSPYVSVPTVKGESQHIERVFSADEASVELAKLDKTVTAHDFATSTIKPQKTPG